MIAGSSGEVSQFCFVTVNICTLNLAQLDASNLAVFGNNGKVEVLERQLAEICVDSCEHKLR